MTARGVFVTGMQRAGTTLFERLVDSHPRASILSQPFPLLFVEAKREFLRELGAAPGELRYPLAHLFREARYRSADFAAFLRAYRPTATRLHRLFQEMARFTGQYTRPDPARLASVLERLEPGDFAATTSDLYRAFPITPGASLRGSKETICEEFLPHFLDGGWAALVVVRDPRDVLASLNHGRGPEFGGQLKPTLFNLRNWRKSVAFALHLEGHPRFAWLRYEDLVTRPLDVLGRVAAALDVAPFTDSVTARATRDASGVPWPGNSSHGRRDGITDQSVGMHRRVLPVAVARYVEAACHAEMRCLGYPVSIDADEVPAILRGFREPYTIARGDVGRDSASEAGAAAEVRRATLVHEPARDDSWTYFIFADVHARLRRAVLTG